MCSDKISRREFMVKTVKAGAVLAGASLFPSFLTDCTSATPGSSGPNKIGCLTDLTGALNSKHDAHGWNHQV